MEELECDKVLYEQRSFVFDPETVRSNGGIFYLIPTLHSLEVTNIEGNTVLVTSASLATLLDPLCLCVLVLLVSLVLLSCTFCCQCCLACLCSAQRNERKPLACKVFCGILSWLLIGIVIVCSAIILWSEFTMETAVGSYGNELLTFVNATVPSENGALSVRQSIQFFFTYQFYRHWFSIALSLMTILIMLAGLLAVTLCAPYKQSMAPVILMLVVNAVWSVLVASMTAVTFFSLFLTSFICYDLYRLGGTARCSDQSLHDYALSLQKFCNTDVYVPHLITVSAYLVLVVCLIAWEILGAFYASSYSRGDGDKRPAAADRGRDRDEAEDRPTTTPSHLQPPVTSHIMNQGHFSRVTSSQSQPTSRPTSTPHVYPSIPITQLTPSLQPNQLVPKRTINTEQNDPLLQVQDLEETSFTSSVLPPLYDDCWQVT